MKPTVGFRNGSVTKCGSGRAPILAFCETETRGFVKREKKGYE